MDKNKTRKYNLCRSSEYEDAAKKYYNDVIRGGAGKNPVGYINFGNLLLRIPEQYEKAERFF